MSSERAAKVLLSAVDAAALGAVFQALAEKLSDGVCIFGPDHRLVQVSTPMATMLGRSPSELVGVDLSELFCPEDADAVNAVFGKSKPSTVECCWKNKDEKPIWTHTSVFPLSDGAGFVAAVQDIGHRQNLEESQARLAAIIESSNDIIISKDLDGIIKSWNKAAEQVLGYSEQEMVGQSILKIVPPEKHAEELDTLARLRNGERIEHFNTVRVAKDGRRIDVSLTMSPIRDGENRVIGASKVARDITEQNKIDETRARLAAIVESSDDAIVSKDLNGIIQTWNKGAENIFGYTAEEIIGKRIHTLLPPDRQGEENLILDRLRKGYRIDHYETIRRRKDGQLIDVSVTVSPVKNSQGQVIGASKVARDITERKRAEEAIRRSEEALRALTEQLEERVKERTAELEAANKEMEGFTYSVSHDLRTPLRAIVATSMVLIEDFASILPAEASEQLQRQAAAAMKMAKLIDELLQYSRVSRAEVHRQHVDLSLLSEELAREIQTQSPKVEFSIQPEMEIMADPRLLRLAMQNLMENASKFSPEGGVVNVGAKTLDDQTVYYVQDHGIGFDMKYAPKLFMPFERLVNDEEFPGTGIGLANVKRIIERHGGRVWAEGVPGKGATVFFVLG